MKGMVDVLFGVTLAVLTASADVTEPFVGSTEPGNTTPAATWPFGQLQPGPDTTWKRTDSYSGLECGYRREHDRLLYFSQTHLSGTGCADLQDLGLRPVDLTGEYFLRQQQARPGFYGCTVGDVVCEMTASRHVAYYRFTGTRPLTVEVNLRTGPKGTNSVTVVETKTEDRRFLVGQNTVNAWLRNRPVHYAFEFAAPFKAARCEEGRWFLDFDATNVQVRVALSRTSVAGARKNLTAEPAAIDFDARRAACEEAWRRIFCRATVEADEVTVRNWRAALYHACFQPNLISDAGEEDEYSTFSTWDTYRAAHPLYTVLVPELVPDFVRSFIRFYERHGKLVVWGLWGEDVHCMPGCHSIPPILEALNKGLAGSTTWEAAYRAVDATLRKRGRGDLAGIMEDGYDDWCASELARRAGDAAGAAFYRDRANDWTNFYDKSTGYIRGKCNTGWVTPFDPFDQYARGYCEGSAAHWSWHVLHDPERLVAAHGGREQAFVDLEKIFRAPEKLPGQRIRYECTGPVGQHAHGNEHCQHVPYFYALLGHPERTAEIVREICERHYKPTPRGICGNEDCGQMSAWYVFSASGFYPFSPASGEYVLGAPQVKKAVFAIGGKTFTVVAKNLSKANRYVKSVTLNGHPLAGCKLHHADLASGGTLEFEMEGPLFRVGLMTDTHVNDKPASCELFKKSMELFKREGCALVCHLGDFADSYSPAGYELCRRHFDATFPDADKAPRFLLAYGNHDWFGYRKKPGEGANAWEGLCAHLKINQRHTDIVEFRGYPFVLAPEGCDKKVLAEKLEKATADFPGKPVFLLLHPPAETTVTLSDTWTDWGLRKVCDRFPNLVHISGHTHGTVRDENQIWQGGFTEVNCGCLQVWDGQIANYRGCLCHGEDGVMVMDVARDALVFHRYSLKTGEEYRPDERWTVPLPFDPKTAPYRPEVRKAASKAPAFAADAKLAVEWEDKPRARGFRFRFPEAPRAYVYRAELFGKDGRRITLTEEYGEFWKSTGAKGFCTMSLRDAFFESGKSYRIAVTPFDGFGNAGAALSADVTAPAFDEERTPIAASEKPMEEGRFERQKSPTELRFVLPPQIAVPDGDPAGTKYQLTLEMEDRHLGVGAWRFAPYNAAANSMLGRYWYLTPAGSAGSVRYAFDFEKEKDGPLPLRLDFSYGGLGGELTITKIRLDRIAKIRW